MSIQNTLTAEEEALAREVRDQVDARFEALKSLAKKNSGGRGESTYQPGDRVADVLAEGFRSGKYEKPSQIFKDKLRWFLDGFLYPRYREAFLTIVDQIRDYPFSWGWSRRSFRSEHYESYCSRIARLTNQVYYIGYLDYDIKDILRRNLPRNVKCFLRFKNNWGPFVPEFLAYGLDQDDPELEDAVRAIILEGNEEAGLSPELISGIVMSHNEKMHALLCDLLLAARLQEGLRQVICENADMGTRAAFDRLFACIADNDLIRYSSVKRAVGTWLGFLNTDPAAVDRISRKTMESIRLYLSDPAACEEALHGNDAMSLYLALWARSLDSIESISQIMADHRRSGTHLQKLVCGYLIRNLGNWNLMHRAALSALLADPQENDVFAIYADCLLPYFQLWSYHNSPIELPPLESYFSSREEAIQCQNLLLKRIGTMGKKELVFDPCIFPWHREVLRRRDLANKAFSIAYLLREQENLENLVPILGDLEPHNRGICVELLGRQKATPVIRDTILKSLSDKSQDVRKAALKVYDGWKTKPEEIPYLEDLLRLRYDDLRRGIIDMMLEWEPQVRGDSISRLLQSPKAEKRAAALDMLKRLHESGEGTEVARFREALSSLPDPTAQEQVLIRDLLATSAQDEPDFLGTEADRYCPEITIGPEEEAAMADFLSCFPESKLPDQVRAGKTVQPRGFLLGFRPCPTMAAAAAHLKSLESYFQSQKSEEFTPPNGMESLPLFSNHLNFRYWVASEQRYITPRMDLWNKWFQEEGMDAKLLLPMLVLARAPVSSCSYLSKCAAYAADVYGRGAEIVPDLSFRQHLIVVLEGLAEEKLSETLRIHVAEALALWVIRCASKEMLLGCADKVPTPSADEPFEITINPVTGTVTRSGGTFRTGRLGHLIAHPQFSCFLSMLRPVRGLVRRQDIPLVHLLATLSAGATEGYCQRKLLDREKINKGQMFVGLYSQGVHSAFETLPCLYVDDFIWARYYGLISEKTMYYHITNPEYMNGTLSLVSGLCALYPAPGENGCPRALFGWQGAHKVNIDQLLGAERDLNPDQQAVAALCREIAGKLIPLVVEGELRRGDSPVTYSPFVRSIHYLSGGEVFVRLLTALGKDTLERSDYDYGSQHSRKFNLSHLLYRCVPRKDDSAESLGKLLKNAKIPTKRLIEAALYCPEWIDIVGEYLGLPGFRSAAYYFMAHMNEDFDDTRKAIMARYTPLSEQELKDGAFDVDWFRSAYAQLGEKEFDLIYDAAKYISDGAKHTRARKYADAALGRLSLEETAKQIAAKRNKDLLMAYAIIPLEGPEDLLERYLFIQKFLKESRQFGSQRSASEKKAAEVALRNLSTNAGFLDTMRLTLRMETRLVEDMADLFRDTQVDAWVLRLSVDENGQAEILCTKDGKAVKSIPAKIKKNPHVQRLTEKKKTLTEQYRRTRRMFEQAMEDGASFEAEELSLLWGNPVARPILSKLVFLSEDKPGFFDGTGLYDTDGAPVEIPAGQSLILAHPLHFFRNGTWPAFQKYLFDRQIRQPFRQVFRELYVKTEDEAGSQFSRRYAGNQIQPRKAAACLKERCWVADVENGLQKVYYKENIVATIFAQADWFTPAEVECPDVEYVAFFHRKTGELLPIAQIPDVIFSEVMRDVDMAVSVAHAGAVDPETSHSTVEMRAAILGYTLPLLGLKNVTIKKDHAFIEGSLAHYSVHLGSGTVHQLGGTMLNVIPVHAQQRGRFFLPFADDDPKTAEIITKVILFSEDKKLKDPTILGQILR